MRSILGLALALSFIAAPAIAATPDAIAAAVADTKRPEKDRERDADRHPADVLTFAGVKPGDRVVDVGPGSGYYSRIISNVVGANGRVIAFNPTWVADKFPKAKDAPAGMVAEGYTNIEGSVQPMDSIAFDKPVDVVFMSQLYHDQHWQKIDIAKMNKAIYAALKPGGIYFIIDHTAPAGTTDAQIDGLHRIDPAVVKAEVLAAGFTFEGESNLLKNAKDPQNVNVFDPSIRGHTDQFIYKFRKPN